MESGGTLTQGTPLIPFQLQSASGEMVSSESFADVRALLVVFTCNHCPYAIASWPTLIDLQNRYGAQGYQAVAINPNNNPSYPDDRFELMLPYAREIGLNFPYLFDETQAVARAYGAVCTPDPFLFRDGRLFYHGRINDNWKDPSAVREHSLEEHIRAALGQGEVAERSYPSMGCSIKWVD
jgi:peroxiredoxin